MVMLTKAKSCTLSFTLSVILESQMPERSMLMYFSLYIHTCSHRLNNPLLYWTQYVKDELSNIKKYIL